MKTNHKDVVRTFARTTIASAVALTEIAPEIAALNPKELTEWLFDAARIVANETGSKVEESTSGRPKFVDGSADAARNVMRRLISTLYDFGIEFPGGRSTMKGTSNASAGPTWQSLAKKAAGLPARDLKKLIAHLIELAE